jgi:hypothetical protein
VCYKNLMSVRRDFLRLGMVEDSRLIKSD